MNRYSFVQAQAQSVSAKDIATSKVSNSVADMLGSIKSIGAYVFSENPELTKAIGKVNSIAISIETLPSKSGDKFVNRARVSSDTGDYFCRLYNSKTLLDESIITDEAVLKAVTFGTCTSDGELVTKANLDRMTGDVVRIPVVYVKM